VDNSQGSDAVRAAQEAALKALEPRRRTRRELERRLAERDLEYARAYVRERLGRRAVGARTVRSQLLARGVPALLADQALQELATGDDPELPRSEADRARRALVQIRRRYDHLDPRARRQRLLAALIRRGFDYDVAGEVVAEAEKGGTRAQEESPGRG
jgi:SOS response regulatory protein OraA/RecX